jgi:hypothetical protein
MRIFFARIIFATESKHRSTIQHVFILKDSLLNKFTIDKVNKNDFEYRKFSNTISNIIRHIPLALNSNGHTK